MKRHRPIPSTGIAVPVTNTRPVLRSSTRFNQIVPTTPAALSYKDLIRVVGVDPESNPLYWRKAIDHSAETVVFFQVDLRGTLPRMCKSVRICQEAGDRQRLIPRVYIGETLLSGDYVKTIIGRRYLADEDDLMKLLEHAGVLKENQEPVVEEQDEENADGDSYSEEREDDAGSPEPVPKRVRFGEKLQAPRTTRIISHDRRPTSHRTVTLATPDHRNTDLGNTGGRHTRDLAPLFPMDNSVKAPIETGVPEDVPDETDFEMSVLPVDDAADYEDDLPLGDDVPGPSASLENADGPTGKMPPIRHSQPHPAVEDNPANNSGEEDETGTDAKCVKEPLYTVPPELVRLGDKSGKWYFSQPGPGKILLHPDVPDVYVEEAVLPWYKNHTNNIDFYSWSMFYTLVGGIKGMNRLESLWHARQQRQIVYLLGKKFLESLERHLESAMPKKKLKCSLSTHLASRFASWRIKNAIKESNKAKSAKMPILVAKDSCAAKSRWLERMS